MGFVESEVPLKRVPDEEAEAMGRYALRFAKAKQV